MQNRGLRGDYFCDRLGGWTEILLAAAALVVVFVRAKSGLTSADLALAVCFTAEIIGASLIIPSKMRLMRGAFWIFAIRVLAGLGYMSIIHGDKLARSTLGFPVVVAVYCFVRMRALRVNP